MLSQVKRSLEQLDVQARGNKDGALLWKKIAENYQS